MSHTTFVNRFLCPIFGVLFTCMFVIWGWFACVMMFIYECTWPIRREIIRRKIARRIPNPLFDSALFDQGQHWTADDPVFGRAYSLGIGWITEFILP